MLQYELSLKRREAIKPSLKKEYAAFCSRNVPVTSLLFGDDLQQQLNNIKASNKISQVSANVNKPHKAGYKGSSSNSAKHRPSDQYYRGSFHIRTFPKILSWRVLLPLSELNFTRL